MSKPAWGRRFAPVIGGGLIVVLVVAALIWFVRGFLQTPVKQQRPQAQVVKLVRPPPPPEEPPPPPPPPEEKIEEPLPQDQPDEPSPEPEQMAEQLGLDAEGVAGADGFGLAARKGGRDIVGSGTGAFVWYTSMLKDSILDVLSADERVRRGSYSITVRIWLADDGRVKDVKLATTSGNRELDSAIERALARMDRIRESPPLEMPQPVTLKIVSRS
ncbi:MAG TPA: cell envelope integrity protein TolA [Steroidobacteraceae bacterium]|nr:cell envelope integrity protein TolA [Steroidobacteraceae bacterium]